MPFPYTMGGGTTHLINLAEALLHKDHEVFIVSSKPSRAYQKIVINNRIKTINIGIKHYKFENFNLLKLLFYIPYRIIFELAFIISTINTLKKLKPDIINTQSLITTSLPCSLTNKKFIATAHGIHSLGFKRLYELNKRPLASIIGSKIYKFIESFNIKKCQRIICLGKDTYNFYKKTNKALIIPNGVNFQKFRTYKNKREKQIISVSRLTKQKAIDKLVLAMDNLKDYTLVIIGEGPMEQHIKELIKNRKNCIFLGYQNEEKIIKYLNASRFIVFPSEFEGLPIAMLEAMACGVIPISTKVGDVGDVIKDGYTGFFVNSNNPRDISKKIRSIEKYNLKKISKNCVATIKENFDWNKIANEYIEVYNDALL